ncbi:LOW QUALITY PROTEIN: transmembrane protein 79 [Colossoma macropomum]|uniref:LOW QUALITY PROTEIN: transmembrane protein 79 n=1 Tax=Colossoma macropomum TaxID=42526 RepID=UPI001864A4D2|nr:LOW QUALITY PROTEIN: transmembrane protein 79 [Colossoma macropomum]
MFNPESDEERGNSETWRGSGHMKDKERDDVEMENESESDGEREREEEREEKTEGEESRTESARELSGEAEVEKWRDEMERNGDGGSLADDEEEDDDEDQKTRIMAAAAFTPLVTIVCPASKQLDLNESNCSEQPEEKGLEHEEEPQTHVYQHLHHLPEWTRAKENAERRCGCCGEIVKLSVGLLAAAAMFPLLVWAGFELLPFDTPPVSSAPFRLVYTLHCAFFATLPIVLGVLVQGVSRFKFGALKPLFDGTRAMRDIVVHGNYVRDSLHLYLLYFIQLAVMATYVRQDMLKLVPLLTIIFVFGRLIYWVCVVFRSSVRSLGFGLSFLPVLVLLGANLYFVCSSVGPEAVFDVAPPTTAPPPKPRWWG